MAGVEVLDGCRLEQESPGTVNRLDSSQGRWWVVSSDLEGFGVGYSEGGAGAGGVN